MKKIARLLLVVLVTMAGLATAGLLYVRSTGLVARTTPGAIETRIARGVRSLAVPQEVRERRNPVVIDPESLAEARAHYADHCAVCHANDGSGETAMGQSMWPKAPDMRLFATQGFTDGELFWIIENGIRFTGMPGWSTGTPEGEDASWHLVHFIRHLPELSQAELDELETLVPRSEAAIRQEIEEERFLRGEDVVPAEPATPAHVH
jgi:mono/diheme cytochrome c family protein